MLRSGLALLAASLALAISPARADDIKAPAYGVSVEQDVVYGQGLVGFARNGGHARDLHMDVYRPLDHGKAMSGRPGILMVFGGAFHRGSKGEDFFEEDGAASSSMADYCRTFARAGYVCIAIEYRLTPEDPGLTKVPDPAILLPRETALSPAATARIEVVRARMGLPALDDASRDQLWRDYFAAVEDLGTAVNYARAHAAGLGLDPERLALGGFSAGAITVVNGAYGKGLPVKAVVSLSGGMGGYDIRKTLKPNMAPGLFFLGQNDLPGIQIAARAAMGSMKAAGVPFESAWVPGFGHFYPMGAVSLGSDMSRTTVEQRVLDFLAAKLGG